MSSHRLAPARAGVRLLSRLEGFAKSLRVRAGGRLAIPGAIVLAYHDVNDGRGRPTAGSISADRLRGHLSAALGWGLRFVDLNELVRRYLAGASLDGLAAVVFDDSLVGVHHHAMPVLLDLEVPATVFTVTDVLGSTPPWWEGAARVMTPDEVEEMSAAGFRISSHSRNHPSLPSLPSDELRNEISGSRRQLEDLIGTRVDLFAYPYGEHNARVRAEVAEAGYRAAFIFLNGRIVPGLDPLRLPRLAMADQSRSRLAYDLARPVHSWRETQLDAIGDPG